MGEKSKGTCVGDDGRQLKKKSHSKKHKRKKEKIKKKKEKRKKHSSKKRKRSSSELSSSEAEDKLEIQQRKKLENTTFPKDTKEDKLTNAKRQRMTPMSREDYERENSKIREVYDPDTGRVRLVKGSGEILERIVSKSRHAEIQQHATLHGWDYSKQ